MTIKVGDIVIYRAGKSTAPKDFLPLGIANCEVIQLGEGPSGEPCAQLKLPQFYADKLNHGEPVWSLIADLEG